MLDFFQPKKPTRPPGFSTLLLRPCAPRCRRNRTSTSSTDAAGPAQSYVQHGPRPPLSDSSSTTAGDVGVYQGYSRPGGVWTLDHRGRWPLEGDTLPRTAVAGEAPVGV